MSCEIQFEATKAGTEFYLLSDGRKQSFDDWAIVADQPTLPAIDLLNRLIAENLALTDNNLVLVENRAVAELSAAEAASLCLPSLSPAVARIETRGLITRPEFSASIQWRNQTGQAIVGAERIGAWLKVGGRFQRLSSPIYLIAEAIDDLNSTNADPGSRLVAIAKLQDLLPIAKERGAATVGGILPVIEITQADAFSLDLVGEGTSARLIPILYRAGENDPLLSSDQQSAFGDDQFNRFSDARSVYTLPGGRFVVLAPTLRRALNEVRKIQSASSRVKRSFMASPRAFLTAALDSGDDPTLVEQVEAVFLETQAYSDRVIGLGLWTPRVVPWIQRVGTDWFGPDAPPGRDLPGGIMVGDERVELDARQAEELREQVEDAIGRGDPTIVWAPTGEAPIVIPANEEVRQALTELATQRAARRPDTEDSGKAKSEIESLLIITNEGEVEFNQDFVLRKGPELGLPINLRTPPKPHQTAGIDWLQKSWLSGRPGVLLADDMGLGKTLQGLAFLAWIRSGIVGRQIDRAPILIVAPTGLLENWRAEHDRHLANEGLGRCLQAYGPGLKAITVRDPEGTPSLDREKLAGADWILTTYETLRDYDRDFGAIRFSVLLADEAQKVKTPGARMTDAMKGMNADFRVALTGTPVENRLADLWCIVDGIHSGWLRDLKSFSREYEAQLDVEKLKKLRSLLEGSYGGAPPLLMRRMKEDELPDLPKAEVLMSERPMPALQAEAYKAVIANVRGQEKKGAVLEALQKLRTIALHPEVNMKCGDDEFIVASARLKACFEALDQIAQKNERALIFVDSLDMQAKLAGLIQRRYKLAQAPALINGEVAGTTRQRRVDAFQGSEAGFDVMILSPRAGGVGLTLTKANHVIHLARWWNPAVEDQCTGRALRIGQTRTVNVHIPIGVLAEGGKSFDQNLHALLERKRRLMRDALLPGGFSEYDQQELFTATTAGAN